MKFSLLSRPLVALLLTHTVLASSITPNHPFRSIALKQQPKREPMCCLTLPPLTESQPTEDELLLSFEDWKAKLFAEEKSNSRTSDDADSAHYTPKTDPVQAADGLESSGHDGGGGKDDVTDPSLALDSVPSTSGRPPSQDQVDFGFAEPAFPHFRVPLTDRFNYASMECSARVHKSHKSAKSSSSILSSKKDRYMLSPCVTKTGDGKEESHFVIVELCEDIRMDTVQLANFEFFSGMFKDFTVSVAKTYTPDMPEWTTVGTYRARNTRGVQSFHSPTSLRDFYRYIRIDFHSHYGSEFYCPVSLLRVYGLTHLEEWKWDSRANRYEQLQVPAHALPLNVNPTSASSVEAVVETILTADPSAESTPEPGRARTKTDTQLSEDTSATTPEPTSTPQDVRVDRGPLSLVYSEPIPVTSTNTPQPSSTVSHSTLDRSQSNSAPTLQTTEVTPTVTVRSSSPAPPPQGTSVILSGSKALLPPPQASTGGGESIYRTIMKRITALELNATLHARYIEEHTVGVRELLKRLTEEVGRLDGIGKVQAQLYQRSLLEMERHQKRLELEHGELMTRVQYLAEEITMEKRLGVAQLCIMVAVLAFMTLTRGSRGESVDHTLLPRLSRHNRTMSLSGEWMRKLRTGSNPTSPTRLFGSSVARKAVSDDMKFQSPTRETPMLERTQNKSQNSAQATSSSVKRSGGRARTPQTRTPKVVRVSAAPTPPLRSGVPRVNSHSHGHNWMSQGLTPSVIALPKSAKRWARTAHVHEIKRKRVDSGVSSQSDVEIETPDEPSSRMGLLNKGKQKETDTVFNGSFTLGESHSRRGSFGRSPLRPTSSTNVPVLDTEVADVWVDTDDTSSEVDGGLNRTKRRFIKSTDTLTIHHPSPGLVGVESP